MCVTQPMFKAGDDYKNLKYLCESWYITRLPSESPYLFGYKSFTRRQDRWMSPVQCAKFLPQRLFTPDYVQPLGQGVLKCEDIQAGLQVKVSINDLAREYIEASSYQGWHVKRYPYTLTMGLQWDDCQHPLITFLVKVNLADIIVANERELSCTTYDIVELVAGPKDVFEEFMAHFNSSRAPHP